MAEAQTHVSSADYLSLLSVLNISFREMDRIDSECHELRHARTRASTPDVPGASRPTREAYPPLPVVGKDSIRRRSDEGANRTSLVHPYDGRSLAYPFFHGCQPFFVC